MNPGPSDTADPAAGAAAPPGPGAPPVLCMADVDATEFAGILRVFGLRLMQLNAGAALPGSYWGEPEAGLVGNRLYVRPDTPVHSALHEAGHFICMDENRRGKLHTDAGGDYTEENGVCYLQILLADRIPEMGRTRMFRDMDAWGYTFRLGSSRAWFEQDAGDARQWLLGQRLIDDRNQPTGRLRI